MTKQRSNHCQDSTANHPSEPLRHATQIVNVSLFHRSYADVLRYSRVVYEPVIRQQSNAQRRQADAETEATLRVSSTSFLEGRGRDWLRLKEIMIGSRVHAMAAFPNTGLTRKHDNFARTRGFLLGKAER